MKGTILRGSLSGGFEIRLDIGEDIEKIKVGTFCIVEGKNYDFFSMVVDEDIEAANQKSVYETNNSNPFLNEILHGTGILYKVKIQPMLVICRETGTVSPVKSIPTHLSKVRDANSIDINSVFGTPNNTNFHVGSPLDMDLLPICINLERFIERSNGIFGKSGTGKTFYTRLMLCGMIKSGLCNTLIYDMHSEYGWEGLDEDKNRRKAKGLKQLFGANVAIFTLDNESSRRRGVRADFVVEIPFDSIEPEDIAMVWEELNLNQTALEVIYFLQKKIGSDWLSIFLKMQVSEILTFSESTGAHIGATQALQRKLMQLLKLPFLKDNPTDDAVKRIMQYLDNGMNVVLEFGHQKSMLAYMLVSNILTRRIHEMYVVRSEKALSSDDNKNTPLVIVIEEAHKFLNKETSKQSIFGMIAREMRKNNVTLLVVDQRPSEIDSEVLSQMGTKIVALLTEEKDIESVMSGANHSKMLKNVLATLDSKQQALILGHSVPMPVLIKTRTYDEQFYKEIQSEYVSKPFQLANEKNLALNDNCNDFEKLMKELYGS